MEQSPKTILEVLDTVIDKHSRKVAIVDCENSLTYDELRIKTQQIADRLLEKKIPHQSVVATRITRSKEFLIAIIGILRAGCAYLPLDLELPASRIEYMLSHSDCQATISFSHSTGEYSVELLSAQNPTSRKTHEVRSDDIAYINFTSGSSGLPKGVQVTHSNVVNLVEDQSYIVLNEATIMLNLANIGFDATTFEVWGPLLNGGTIVVYSQDGVSFESLGKEIQSNSINCAFFTPALLDAILDVKPEILRGIDQIIAGGEAFSISLATKAIKHHPHTRFVNGYGPTETTTFAIAHDVVQKNIDQKLIPLGNPLNNVSISIVDEQLRRIETGEAGEIIIQGCGVAAGYINSKEETEKRFFSFKNDKGLEQPSYRTGDRGRRLEDGTIEFLGRIDNQVKIRGNRIELSEVIKALQNGLDGMEVFVQVEGENYDNKKIVAYLKKTNAHDVVDVPELKATLGKTIPKFMVPALIETVNYYPLTQNGKIDGRKLAQTRAQKCSINL